MRLALFVGMVIGLSSAPATASDVKEAITESCRSGLVSMKDDVSFEVEGGREARLEKLDRDIDLYCACLVDALPMKRLTPRKVEHTHYVLETMMSEKSELERRIELSWRGLDRSTMEFVAMDVFEANLKCAKAASW